MGTERVDKAWPTKGIETYSVEAILGTLSHYGVVVDEPAFRAFAQSSYPLGIAIRWHQQWKGTGPFSRFPAAAAEELWRRWLPNELAPTDVALAVIKLTAQLVELADGGKLDGTLETRFRVVEAYLPRLPQDASRREAFIEELVGTLGEWQEPFDAMVEVLTEKKHDALAERFVALEETLLPDRKGIVSAILRAERGDTDGAIADIAGIAQDATRDNWNRLAAIDALFDFEAHQRTAAPLLALFDSADESKDVELLSAVAERVKHLLELEPNPPERAAIVERVKRVLERSPESE
jgi:hypothetical protein